MTKVIFYVDIALIWKSRLQLSIWTPDHKITSLNPEIKGITANVWSDT